MQPLLPPPLQRPTLAPIALAHAPPPLPPAARAWSAPPPPPLARQQSSLRSTQHTPAGPVQLRASCELRVSGNFGSLGSDALVPGVSGALDSLLAEATPGSSSGAADRTQPSLASTLQYLCSEADTWTPDDLDCSIDPLAPAQSAAWRELRWCRDTSCCLSELM
jgi:hypothetical protein